MGLICDYAYYITSTKSIHGIKFSSDWVSGINFKGDRWEGPEETTAAQSLSI
jgi:hypothetical protein